MVARGAVRAATVAIRRAPILEKDASEAILLAAFQQAPSQYWCLSVCQPRKSKSSLWGTKHGPKECI